VGNHLLASIKEVLGDAATPDILDAWEEAYNQLADLMIKIEGGMYEKARKSPGGWTGWRPFVVAKKKKESEEITSFYLKPKDGGQVLEHTPGQFISLRIHLPELGLNQARQYSISSIPDPSFYRISVKKEKDQNLNIDGLISNHLHLNIHEGDVVELTAPAGNFTLGKTLDSPTTFISGGVGLTPLMSMLLSAAQHNPDHALTWIHSCRNERVHAFKEPVQDLFEGHPQVSRHVFYDELREGNQKEGINKGPLNLRGIAGLPKDGKYYICGPAGFIKKHRDDLVELGVPESSIEFEEFGPQLLHLN
jgi:nitric oxide dioxygenase